MSIAQYTGQNGIESGVRWTSSGGTEYSPTIRFTFSYDYRRVGADMQYKLYCYPSGVSGSSYFGYTLVFSGSLDGTAFATNYQMKASSPSQWSEGAYGYASTDWITVAGKSSGTTELSVTISTNSSARSNLNKTYQLAVTPAASVIGTVSNFNIEDGFSVPVTKYSASFVDTLTVKLGTTTIATRTNYTSGTIINLTDAELLSAYANIGANANTAVFTFTITTSSGSTTVGTSSGTATGTITGTVKTKQNGSWVNGIPWIKVGGTWVRSIMKTNVNGDWKRGS